MYLDWFVASGFVGLIAYLALYVLFIMAVWRHSKLSVAEKSVLTGLIAGYAIHNIFVFDNIASYVLFFALLGFGESISGEHHANKNSKFHNMLRDKSFGVEAVKYVVAPVVLVVLVASLYYFTIQPIQANTRLIAALQSCQDPSGNANPDTFVRALETNSHTANQEIREQILSCTRGIIANPYPNELKQKYFELAKQEIAAQIAETPHDARIYVLGGSFLSSIGQVQDALPILEKAHELTPAKQSVSLELANLYMTVGKKDEAVALLKVAYESDPTYPDAKFAYITGLIFADREAEARKIFADSPEAFETQQVAQAYGVMKQSAKAIAIYRKLIEKDPTNVELKAQLAQVQYLAGMTSAAIETLNSIIKDRPELKAQVEEAIKQLQAPK